MPYDLADRLIQSTAAELDSPAEWIRAQRFFYNTVYAVRSHLPKVAQEQLGQRGVELPAVANLEAARVTLWKAIEGDQMGTAPGAAAIRATLFAFLSPETDGPLDAIVFFCNYFTRAGLPESALVEAFHEQWPQDGG